MSAANTTGAVRRAIAWWVLRRLFAKELAQATSAAVLLLRESAPSSPAPAADRSAPLALELLDIHPANPTERCLSLSAFLGAGPMQPSGQEFWASPNHRTDAPEAGHE